MKVIQLIKPGAQIPICRDCVHARPDQSIVFWFSRFRWTYAKCARSKQKFTPEMLVTGVRREGDSQYYCSTERSGYTKESCGEEGRFFESKRRK